MRRAAKVDANQSRIVEALRGVGASVQPLHTVGGGCPDLLVGYQKRNLLLEVKDGDKVPSQQKLRKSQIAWMDGWRGSACMVTSVDEALVAIGARSRDLPQDPKENTREAGK